MEEQELQTPDNQQELPMQSANERWKEGLKKKHPDRKFEDEDEYYQTSMDGYDQEHEKVKSMLSANKDLADKMERDPKAAAALAEFMEGKPLPVALRKYFDDEELTMSEGDEHYSTYLEAVNERSARMEKDKAMQAEYEANLEASQQTIEAFAGEKGMTPEEFDAFIETAVGKIISPLLEGRMGADALEMLYKGLNYENDVAVAADANFKRGKNEKIMESKKTLQSDGLPDTSGGGGVDSKAKEVDPTSQALDGIISRSAHEDIFARGGYTRKGK